MKRYVLILDLKDSPESIAAYEEHHRKVWPEVIKGIKEVGILKMEIFRFSNRLCMLLETTEAFSFGDKKKYDDKHPEIRAWETLMDTYQQRIPGADPNQKWVLMESIFSLP